MRTLCLLAVMIGISLLALTTIELVRKGENPPKEEKFLFSELDLPLELGEMKEGQSFSLILKGQVKGEETPRAFNLTIIPAASVRPEGWPKGQKSPYIDLAVTWKTQDGKGGTGRGEMRPDASFLLHDIGDQGPKGVWRGRLGMITEAGGGFMPRGEFFARDVQNNYAGPKAQ
jgi:hypothetical protein